MQPNYSYFICTTPYSGSKLLCAGLRQTDIAGRPREYFAVLGKKLYEEQLAVSTKPENAHGVAKHRDICLGEDYLAAVFAYGTSRNGVFGTEVVWDYFDDLVCRLRQLSAYKEMPVLNLLSAHFPNLHFIWMTRRDKERQAAALWRAYQTASGMGDHTLSSGRELPARFEIIERLALGIAADEANWLNFFKACGIQPITVIYEEFMTSYQTTIRHLLQDLCIPTPENSFFHFNTQESITSSKRTR